MTGLSTAAIYVIQTLGSLYLLIVLLRFILQLVRADFYNPLSQFIVRATKPLLNPLRRVIPGFGGVDFASLVLAILVQLVLMIVTLTLMGYGVGGYILQLLVWSVIAVTSLFLKVFFFALIISVILSWVAPGSYNPGAQLINQICEPMLMPFRRLLPNLGGLDISPDGTQILFGASQTAEASLADYGTWSIPAPLGGTPRKLIGRALGSRFSPDGRRILSVRPGGGGGGAGQSGAGAASGIGAEANRPGPPTPSSPAEPATAMPPTIRPPRPATAGANHGRLLTRRPGLPRVGGRLGVEVALGTSMCSGASMCSDSVMVSSVSRAPLQCQGLYCPTDVAAQC